MKKEKEIIVHQEKYCGCRIRYIVRPAEGASPRRFVVQYPACMGYSGETLARERFIYFRERVRRMGGPVFPEFFEAIET